LIKSVPNPSLSPPSLHSGIANSNTSGFYFAPDALVSSYKSKAPTVEVRVANGKPERLVASTILALVPSLPPAAMAGHIMPSFPHTLIGLGPFSDQDCRIIFTEITITVYHPA
jgi:hypothetical protein